MKVRQSRAHTTQLDNFTRQYVRKGIRILLDKYNNYEVIYLKQNYLSNQSHFKFGISCDYAAVIVYIDFWCN